ncbi:hypothetical protein CFC21_073465 [Triticum aestivum]|uniref:Response regulatory domain-containing protein n=2 Tax=Triticum aestivum TaxID=4565 RepID=A0A9R1KV68_WHEAT|nr:hypothetical protein CFC21_073465 [Triticum aestivum]
MDRRRITVLLVEDEEIHRVVARAVLRAAGVEADEAENGAEAVRRVRGRVGGGGAGAYDLILTDKQMPVMDGREATRQIRAMGVTTPIVAVSSDNLPSDVQAFIAAGADDFTPKVTIHPIHRINRVLLLMCVPNAHDSRSDRLLMHAHAPIPCMQPLTKEKLGHILSKFGLA